MKIGTTIQNKETSAWILFEIPKGLLSETTYKRFER